MEGHLADVTESLGVGTDPTHLMSESKRHMGGGVWVFPTEQLVLDKNENLLCK